jgi:hypothetical protein
MCHLDVVVLHGADVECATCGARGRLAPDPRVTWTDLASSVISMDEKRAHAAEIQETAARHAGLRDQIEQRARAFEAYDPVVRPLGAVPVQWCRPGPTSCGPAPGMTTVAVVPPGTSTSSSIDPPVTRQAISMGPNGPT